MGQTGDMQQKRVPIRRLASKDISAKDVRDEILFFSNLEQLWDPQE